MTVAVRHLRLERLQSHRRIREDVVKIWGHRKIIVAARIIIRIKTDTIISSWRSRRRATWSTRSWCSWTARGAGAATSRRASLSSTRRKCSMSRCSSSFHQHTYQNKRWIWTMGRIQRRGRASSISTQCAEIAKVKKFHRSRCTMKMSRCRRRPCAACPSDKRASSKSPNFIIRVAAQAARFFEFVWSKDWDSENQSSSINPIYYCLSISQLYLKHS